MTTENPVHRFLTDENQKARLDELKEFIGPNAEKFLPVYESMRARLIALPGSPKPKWTRGFVWPAFFLGPVWFFYRKMWVTATVLLAVVILIGLIPLHATSRLGIPIGIALAFSGQSFYLNHAIKRIVALRGTDPVADFSRLSKAGGVSRVAGYITAGFYVLVIGAAIASIAMGGPEALRH